MRIVGGRLRGRRLEAPDGTALRPTADRTREALFNILCQGKLDWRPNRPEGGSVSGANPPGGNPLTGARALDAFAGTGALGLEALSRGALDEVPAKVLAEQLGLGGGDRKIGTAKAKPKPPRPGGKRPGGRKPGASKAKRGRSGASKTGATHAHRRRPS